MKKSILLLALICSLCLLNNISYAQASNWQWAKSAGGNVLDYASSLALDASGNAYVVGTFFSPVIAFGSNNLINAGGNDAFLVKYDASGNVLWAKSVGGISLEYGKSVAVDTSGNVYVTGDFRSHTITFDSDSLTNVGGTDVFLAKYDATGNVLWAKSAGGTDIDAVFSVALDASGNAFVTGEFRSPTITFDTYTLTNVGIGNMFLAKYDASGNVLWAKSVGGLSADYGNAVALDVSGNVYVTGSFSSPVISFGTYTLTNVGSSDVFLAKYNTNGNVLWAKSAGGISDDYGISVALDTSGNAFVTGNFYSPNVTFDSDTLTYNGFYGTPNGFVAKYDTSGNVLWAKRTIGKYFYYGNSVALDVSGNAFVTGGAFTLTDTVHEDIFLAKYDASGNMLWTKSVGGTSYDNGVSVALDASGNAYVTGNFYSPTISFDSDILTNLGSGDVFLAKLSSLTGINELNNSTTVKMFPNPAAEKITIEAQTRGSLTILNLEGQKLLIHQITEHKTQIDISSLPKGVYFVRITNDRMVEVGKIIKQ